MRLAGRTRDFTVGDVFIGMGETRDVTLTVSERYTGAPVQIPIRVIRAHEAGPTLFVTAAVHGDELNGTGIVRHIMTDSDHQLACGTLLLVPVVNVLGMEQHSRYLPDRRDLNRSFPGSASGSLASRIAHLVFKNIVKNSDYGIDLHTAATGRTNFPHLRADLSIPGVDTIARAFGAEVVLSSRGDRRTLRTCATQVGCPTIVLEAGEPLKIEPAAVEVGLRGVLNVLMALGMVEGEPTALAHPITADRSVWVRSRAGGLLRFHISPGQLVHKGDAVATVDNLFVHKSVTFKAPVTGVVIGLRTLPAVKPGDPICNIAIPEQSLSKVREAVDSDSGSLHHRVQTSRTSSVEVSEPPSQRGAYADIDDSYASEPSPDTPGEYE